METLISAFKQDKISHAAKTTAASPATVEQLAVGVLNTQTLLL